ncbi:MAG: TetR/AcrR family transcriptional regulator [Caulobacterales bacterium]|jgi:AcrR family transcriptional regulator
MPRALGQIDQTKRTAILEAAAAVFTERGFSAPLELIAARAGVSKQTLYNQFGSRDVLLRDLINSRRSLVTAVFDSPGAKDNPEDTLAAFAIALLQRYCAPGSADLMRIAISIAREQPDIASTIFESGNLAARARLAAYLAQQSHLQRLHIPQPDAAAEQFIGMVAGQLLIGLLLGVQPPPSSDELDQRAHDCAKRFCRAYACA